MYFYLHLIISWWLTLSAKFEYGNFHKIRSQRNQFLTFRRKNLTAYVLYTIRCVAWLFAYLRRAALFSHSDFFLKLILLWLEISCNKGDYGEHRFASVISHVRRRRIQKISKGSKCVTYDIKFTKFYPQKLSNCYKCLAAYSVRSLLHEWAVKPSISGVSNCLNM